jgi:hypothetical protein
MTIKNRLRNLEQQKQRQDREREERERQEHLMKVRKEAKRVKDMTDEELDAIIAECTGLTSEQVGAMKHYRVRPLGQVESIRERFYAISVERKLKHPAVVAITAAAREKLFA